MPAYRVIRAFAVTKKDQSKHPGWETYSYEGLTQLFGGNDDAVRLMADLSRCAHLYDDLIDGDKTLNQDDVHDLMWRLLFSLPENPFYRQHQDLIRPVIATGIMNWRAANSIETNGNEEELRIAHVIRYSIADVALLILIILFGQEEAAKRSRSVRLMAQNDTWANYRSEHIHSKGANYDDETRDFLAHGITVYDCSLLAETEDEHCLKLFEFAELDGWLSKKTVVDVGCGAGGLLDRMRWKYPENKFYGATNSEVQLDIIDGKGFVPFRFDMNDPVLPEADLFVFTQSIGHSQDMPTVIKECAEKLHSGGRLLIKDFDSQSVCTASTWNYRFEPFHNFIEAAQQNGLTPVKIEFPKVDNARYINFWNTSRYMHEAHGEPYGVNARTVLFLFEKTKQQESN